MKYIKGMSVKETPVKAIFDGEEVELTDQQMRHMGYLPIEEAIIAQGDQLMALEPDPVEIKDEMFRSVKVVIPTGGLPFKLGYVWKPVMSGDRIVFESVRDDNAIGTPSTPIIFVDGVRLVTNAYYLHNSSRYVYVGQPGTAGTWEDTEDNMEEF